jgi:recombinational DNA repair protein RecT
MSTANLPATTDAAKQPTTLAHWVKQASVRDRIVNSLGNVMPPDQFIAHALVSFSTPEIKECTVNSQLHTLCAMAAMGVLPTLGQCALITYWNSDLGQSEVKLMIQWQGMKAMAERHPSILEVQPVLVHVKDHFSYLNGVVEHSFDPFDPERVINGPADIRGGYLKIVYRDSRPDKYHFTSVAHIEKCRMCAKPSKKSGKREVWDAWFEQQALKTVVRDAYARRAFPVDPLAAGRLEQMLHTDDALLGNDPARPLALEGPAEPEQPKPKSRVEQMAAALKPPPSSEPVGVTDHVGTEQPEPLDEPPPFMPDADALDVDQSESEADQSASEPPPEAEKKQANAQDPLAKYTTAIGSLSTAASCQEFREVVLPGVPDQIRPDVLKTLLARQIALEVSLGNLRGIMKEFPALAGTVNQRMAAIKASRGVSSNRDGQ